MPPFRLPTFAIPLFGDAEIFSGDPEPYWNFGDGEAGEGVLNFGTWFV